MTHALHQGHVLDVLPTLEAGSVRTCVTSPPYWGLRDYGLPPSEWPCIVYAPMPGLQRVVVEEWSGCLGLEQDPFAFVGHLVAVFREVRRVLAEDGTLWCNLGDGWTSGGRNYRAPDRMSPGRREMGRGDRPDVPSGLKPKDLLGIPWRVAWALQADGWFLRSEVIWCLSGGTWLYAKTHRGVGLMMVRDLARLDPLTVELWNGQRWTRLLGMSCNPRRGDELEIVLRSGERINCTPTHRFPTSRGLLDAGSIRVGDTLQRCILPEPAEPREDALDEDAAWFAGLYLAEGSRSGRTIQISGHAKEEERWTRMQRVAHKFGGSATRTVAGNTMNIRAYGRVLVAIIEDFVSGRTASDKGFAPKTWRRSNCFLDAMLDGYLSGDGAWDASNKRWRLGFARNYNLERDLRAACARLGYELRLKMGHATYQGGRVPAFRGELRKYRSGHRNEKDSCEVVAIRKSRCREVYDLGVADEPHLFSLASGILTHNSKPNPMTESVKDRPTKAHEQVFLLAKSQRYFYDTGVIAEPVQYPDRARRARENKAAGRVGDTYSIGSGRMDGNPHMSGGFATDRETRNKRSVWTIPTQPFSGAHFATMPPELARICIRAGSAPGDVVLDPFSGAGTTGLVASREGRRFVGVELSEDYCRLARERWRDEAPLLMGGT